MSDDPQIRMPTSQMFAQCNVSKDWAVETSIDLMEHFGLPAPAGKALAWTTEEGLIINLFDLPDHCIITYTMQISTAREFFGALLEASAWVPESFMNLQDAKPIHMPLDIEATDNGTYNLFDHPDFEYGGDAPLGGTNDDWEKWFQENITDKLQ